MDIEITAREPLLPTPLRQSIALPGLQYLGYEPNIETMAYMPPVVVFDRLPLLKAIDYFRSSFDPNNKVEVGITLLGKATEANNLQVLNVKGFRLWGATDRGDMRVGLNLANDIGRHLDPLDTEFGDILGTCHLHPELGARPSALDYNANRMIYNYLGNNFPNRRNQLSPFFMIYNAERGTKTHSISIHTIEEDNSRPNKGHVRVPAIYVNGHIDDPKVNFYDPSR